MSIWNICQSDINTSQIQDNLSVDKYSDREYKIDIEEASVNIDFVKEEPEEDVLNFEEKNQADICKSILKVESTDGVNTESISLHEIKIDVEKHNLINFLEDKAIFEEKTLKSEGMKEPREIKIIFDNRFSEDIIKEQFYCNDCSADCKGFCSKCLILTHILNSDIPRTNSECANKAIPSDILEIRTTFDEQGVFALKILPENLMLGPFKGVSPTKNSDKFMWRIKDGGLLNMQNRNWMQYINCVTNSSTNNLDVFQFEGNLFYQTNREIGEGEELLVYHKEETIQISDNKEDSCFNPTLVVESQQVFACTYCCLGFKLEECLIKHKQKCPYAVHNIPEIIQCFFCNIWLDKQEYMQHNIFCQKKSPRLRKYPAGIDGSKRNVSSSSSTQILNKHSDDVEKVPKCTKCYYQTKRNRNLASHNMLSKRTVSIEKHHKCSFQANYKCELKKHFLNKPSAGMEKRLKYTDCSFQTNYRSDLAVHIINKHTVGMEERYICTECLFQTIHKSHLTMHMNTHVVEMKKKRHQCMKCSFQTNNKSHLTRHMNKHNEETEMPYNCTECSYQTYYKSSLTSHILSRHIVGIEKPHICMGCSFQTAYKSVLTRHILRKHNEETEKRLRHKCSVCPYKTHRKNNLTQHIICKHCIPTGRHHKCSACSYKTNNKSDLAMHVLNKHTAEMTQGHKCRECSFETKLESNLTRHIIDKHSGGIEETLQVYGMFL